MIHKALKCDVADVEGGLGLVQVDGAWERSCVVGTQRREAKGAKWVCHILTLTWAEM